MDGAGERVGMTNVVVAWNLECWNRADVLVVTYSRKTQRVVFVLGLVSLTNSLISGKNVPCGRYAKAQTLSVSVTDSELLLVLRSLSDRGFPLSQQGRFWRGPPN